MKKINFTKIVGAGNDFIIIDAKKGLNLKKLAINVCDRTNGIGADGLLVLDKSKKADYKMRIINSDGTEAEMCGNGARCVARFAYVKGIAGENLSFETEAGVVSGQVKDDRVKVKMPDPVELRLDYDIELKSGPVTVSSVNTGVPHVVVMNETVEDINVFELGREIRFHEAFTPAGTNVNFICQQKQGHLAIRTYERGVENETLACGTGSIAAALITSCKAKWQSPINLVTRSGESLSIYFKKDGHNFSNIYLEGDARIIYSAELWEDAWKS